MNLDELQSVQSKERQASDLQHLRPSFYADAAEFIRELREQRQRVVSEEGIDSPEFERLTDDIKTAERAVESIYERRVGKVVKKASIAAADMPTEDKGLTEEERDLFETLVVDIRTNRGRILSTLNDDTDAPATAGDASTPTSGGGRSDGPTASGSDDPARGDPEAVDSGGAEKVDAADLMGGGAGDDARAEASPAGSRRPDPEPVADRDAAPSSAEPGDPGPTSKPVPSPESGRNPADAAGAGTDAGDPDEYATSSADESRTKQAGGPGSGTDVDRATVRITCDVGEIFGVDQRAYHLASEDVVTLPEANAEPLVERGAAERIE